MSTSNDVESLVTEPHAEMAVSVPEPVIRRHDPVTAALRMPLAGVWIALRFLLVPALWIPFKLGSQMRWAYKIDSFMKRTLYPLTESSDEVNVHALGPEVPGVDMMPNVEVQQGTCSLSLAEIAKGRPVLLVLFRGSWCPYSRLHLSDLAAAHKRFKELGITVIAASVNDDEAWWRSKGVNFSFAADPSGELFSALGVKMKPALAQQVWGMLLPHESVFLFDRRGKLIASDVRRLNSMKTRQTFLSATKWLDMARKI